MDDVYLIEGCAHTLTWRGVLIWKNPLDLFVYQEIVREVRPTLVIETGTNLGGSALFWADMLELYGGGRVVTVDIQDRKLEDDARIMHIVGPSTHEGTVEYVRGLVKKNDRVLVNLDSDHSYEHVSQELALYASFVSEGSYLICEDGIDEVLFERKSVLSATRDFLELHPEYTADRNCERYGLTNCPEGFLRRT